MNIIKIDDLSLLKGIEALKNNFEIPENIKLNIEKGEKLKIKWEEDTVYISYPLKASLMRALSLVSLDLKRGERNNIEETLYFDECGVMLDLSRNGVMTVEAVKKYADQSGPPRSDESTSPVKRRRSDGPRTIRPSGAAS